MDGDDRTEQSPDDGLTLEPDQPQQAAATETPGVGGADTDMPKKTSQAKKKTAGPRAVKPRAEKKPRAPRKAKALKKDAPDAAAGLRKHPKNKILYLNTATAFAVVRKALKAIVESLDGDELREAQRLILRIDARKD